MAVPEKIQGEMERLFEWVNKEREGYHPVEFAAQIHKRFVFIHPFKDGNGRVARLFMNLALIQDGYLPAIVPPILRGDYVSLLERANRDDREFIAEREFESQEEILRLFHIPLPSQGRGINSLLPRKYGLGTYKRKRAKIGNILKNFSCQMQ